MKKATLRIVLTICVLTVICAGAARGAPVTQTLTLRPGWNAVFLEVEPPDPAPAVVLAGIAGVESVWAWNPRTSPVEYVQNPGLPLEPPPYMLAYVPGNPLVTNLHAIRGENAYLVKIAAGAPVTQPWSITGQPAVPKASWMPNSFNLVGFHLSTTPGSEPLFADFFSGSPAHAGQEVYVLDNATGQWQLVASPSARMKRGESFWVYCKGSSSFAGPLSVQFELGGGLDFGQALDQQAVILRNDSPAQRSATVRAATGAARTRYWKSDPELITGVWEDLASAPPTVPIEAGGRQRLRLGVVRAGLAAGATYEDNVEVTDGQGVRILLPVTVEGVSGAGLWVGSVFVTKVADSGSGSAAPTPVGSPFVFKVILHVSDAATPQVRLLREVVQLWEQGTWKPDPDNLGHLVVDQPGRFVLVGNPDLLRTWANGTIPGLRGAALRDGQEVGRRISTAAFGFDEPQGPTGGSFAPGSTLTFTVGMAPDDPANPFLHRYHKEHGAAGAYEVVRTLGFRFQLEDPAGAPGQEVPFLGWGSNEVGGVFTETIGLRRADPGNASAGYACPDPQTDPPTPCDALYEVDVEGTFRLRRVSDVGQLLVQQP